MTFIPHAEIDARLNWPDLIAALRASFAAGTIQTPPRQVLEINLPDGGKASLLVMPAFEAGKSIGVKVVTFFPDNAAKGKATINAGMMMFDGSDGHFTAALDGDAITARRTAAASALAADYLARKDAERLLIVGTGQLALSVAAAHGAVRPYRDVLIWGRSTDKAAQIAARLRDEGLPAQVTEALEPACRTADVISTVTASTSPLIRGAWLKEGAHLDLIGAFKPDMRECDTEAVTQAQVFVDTREGALLAGDLATPISEGAFAPGHIVADLTELTQSRHPGRKAASERTVFKSVGHASEDLAAAALVLSD